MMRSRWIGVLCALAWTVVAPAARAQQPGIVVPLQPGLTIVSAVVGDVRRGDYETVVSVTGVSEREVGLKTSAEVNEGKSKRTLTAIRTVSRADLLHAPVQILGFNEAEAVAFPGTTSLGPSLDIVQALRAPGRATYGVKNYASKLTSSGAISRVEPNTVAFSVLLNGRRTTVPAIHAAGSLRYAEGERPWDLYILDDAVHPLLLRIAYGPVGGGLPVRPEWTRQVVRIDSPEPRPTTEATLSSACRVEATGVYFEFNSASLNPQSEPAIRSIAELLHRRADWKLEIEGHTDDIGSDRENQDLSERRAAAVREAVVRQLPAAATRLTTTGFGEKRPRETNATPEGRARNRRVELVRPCGALK
ncbi:MAG: OmpA family protein [Gemmatimonadaceae bacterium]